MIEHGFTPEHAQMVNEAGLALMLYGMAFSKTIRNKVYKDQGGNCADCGEHFARLETHHIIPHALGGPDTIDNAVGLCTCGKCGGNGCHEEADRLAFQGIIYPQVHK